MERFGADLSGAGSEGYGTELHPRQPQVGRRAYGLLLDAPTGGAYGPDLEAITYQVDPERDGRAAYGPALRGPAGGTYGLDLLAGDALAPAPEPPGSELLEPPSLVATWGQSARRALRRLGPMRASAYASSLAGDPRDLAGGAIDYRPAVIAAHRQHLGQLPGPPRANSPRRDPEHALVWSAPHARDLTQYDDLIPSATVDAERGGAFGQGAPATLGMLGRYDPAPAARTRHGADRWQDAPARDRQGHDAWRQGRPTDPTRTDHYGEGTPRDHSRLAPYSPRPPARDVVRLDQYGDLPALDVAHATEQGRLRPRNRGAQQRYGPQPGRWVWIPPLRVPADGGQVIADPGGDPHRRGRPIFPPGEHPAPHPSVYAYNRVRVTDGEGRELRVRELSISSDLDSWAWGVSMTSADAEGAAGLSPYGRSEPPELTVEVNGWRWRFIVEEYSAERAHPEDTQRITGRSRTALLDTPHQPQGALEPSEALDVAELAAAPLEGTGVALDWRLARWEVPAGAWRVRKASPVRAVTKLASALGAAVYTPPEGDRLIVRQRYRRAPHLWAATGDVRRLPIALVTAAASRWEGSPRYAYAWVHGTTEHGITVRCARDAWHDPGSDQYTLAPISSALVTSRAAARERGRAALDASGPKVIDTLTLPLAEQTGLLEPGELVRFYDARVEATGTVLRTTLRVRGETVHQEIELETRPESYRIAPDGEELEAPEEVETDTTGDYQEMRPGYWHWRLASGPRDTSAAEGVLDARRINSEESST